MTKISFKMTAILRKFLLFLFFYDHEKETNKGKATSSPFSVAHLEETSHYLILYWYGEAFLAVLKANSVLEIQGGTTLKFSLLAL